MTSGSHLKTFAWGLVTGAVGWWIVLGLAFGFTRMLGRLLIGGLVHGDLY